MELLEKRQGGVVLRFSDSNTIPPAGPELLRHTWAVRRYSSPEWVRTPLDAREDET